MIATTTDNNNMAGQTGSTYISRTVKDSVKIPTTHQQHRHSFKNTVMSSVQQSVGSADWL